MAKSIDLNADIGEYTGTSGAALDDSILDVVSSASIACGGEHFRQPAKRNHASRWHPPVHRYGHRIGEYIGEMEH